MTPQKPIFTFIVGVTGHRMNKLPIEQVSRIEQQLRSVFADIDTACAQEKSRSAGFFASTLHQVRLVSGLAEGIDQMAVSIRPAGWHVDAVLPFPQARYTADFAPQRATGGVDRRAEFSAALAQAETVVELPHEGDEPAAYQASGEFILRQSDLLVAVWDGRPKAGTGGTESVVSRAIETGVPVIWICSDRDQPPTLLSGQTAADHPTDQCAATLASIAQMVTTAVALPESHPAEPGHAHHHSVPARTRLVDFLAEAWRPHCRWVAFDCLKRWPRFWTWRAAIPLRSLVDYRRDWASFRSEAPGGAGFSQRLDDGLLVRYAWADSLATYFSHAYRSVYTLSYVLSAIAVAIALIDVLPILPHDAGEHAGLTLKAVLAALELCAVAAIIGLVWKGRTQRWHNRWMDYRALAEMLRHLRFLGLVGEGAASSRPLAGNPAGADWVGWYVRAARRELGTGEGVLDADYQRKALQLVKRIEIDHQISYHRANATDLSTLDRRLHHLGNWCFFLTALLLVVYLLAYLGVSALGSANPGAAAHAAGVLHAAVPWITFLDAFLPAMGAAVAGIRFTGDFEGFAIRSGETAADLQNLKRDYAEGMSEPRLLETCEILIATAEVLAEDIGGWRSLYRRKRLALPA